ncbi:SNAP25 ous protein [Ancistrocladus abbreviatus]
MLNPVTHQPLLIPPGRTSPEPIPISPDSDDDDWGKQPASSTTSPYRPPTAVQKNRYKNDFRDSGGLENQSLQELENYAVFKAEETTSTVNNCLSIAEDTREDAARTLDTLHQQGEQITRTHQMAVNIDRDLSKGEKLLSSIGEMFTNQGSQRRPRILVVHHPHQGMAVDMGTELDRSVFLLSILIGTRFQFFDRDYLMLLPQENNRVKRKGDDNLIHNS